MQNEITFSSPVLKINRVVNHLILLVLQPVAWLRQYYSEVLEREVSMRQMWLLLNAQAAFFFAVFPVSCPLLLRAVFTAWFIHAVMLCKRNF